MVINYKRLNDNTCDDAYKIPNKDSLINSIQGCKYFSQLNCKSGFWKIRLEEDNKPWTTFSCPCGLYEWNVMPFGLNNAPQIFQRMMDNIFEYGRSKTCKNRLFIRTRVRITSNK